MYTTLIPISGIRSVDVAWADSALQSGGTEDDDEDDGENALSSRCTSSYDEEGRFTNCFHIRNSSASRSCQAMSLPPTRKYRSQLEPFFGEDVEVRGKLLATTTYNNCVRVVLGDVCVPAASEKGFEVSSIKELCLFPSRDFQAPELGTEMSARGKVYAYQVASPDGQYKQLRLDPTMLAGK